MVGRALDLSYPADVRASLGLLTAARLGANSIYRFAPPFLAVIAADLDVSLATLGLVLAVSELLGLLGPAIGSVSERLPRRAAMVAGLAGVAGGAVLAGAGPGPVLLTVGLVAVGLAKMLFDVSLIGWVSERVPYGQRGRAIGLTETAWAGGLLVGVPLMGLVSAAASWRWAYVAAALGLLALALALVRRLPHQPAPAATGLTPADGGRIEASRRRLGAGWLLVLAMGLLLAGSQAIVVVFGPWLEDRHGVGVLGLAAVVVVLGAAELVASLATASRADRLGKAKAMALGLAAMVPTALALVVGGGLLAVGLVALVVFMAGFEFAIVSSIPMSTELVPGAPAAGMGLSIGAGTLGRAAVSVPATAGYEHWGLWFPAVLAAGLSACSLLAVAAYRRHHPHA
jgi:predicted MFS family arabinose efflux permease